MRAVCVRQPGGVEVLEVRDLPDPEPQAHEVIIDVRAAGLNRADLLQRRGVYPAPAGASQVLGLECAGIVERVGAEVAQVRVGDRVMALLPGGGYASKVAVSAGLLLPIPSGLSFVEGAAIPEAFLTAQEALVTLGAVESGHRVLVHAAAGGVGSAAVQLAKALGARVIATTGSQAKADLVRSLGADEVIDYHSQDFAEVALQLTEGHGVDAVMDFVGASYAARHQRCLRVAGRWVVIGVLGGRTAEIDLGLVLARRLQLRGLVMRTRPLSERESIVAAFRERFWPLFEAGRLRPVVGKTFSLAQVADAHLHLEANEAMGKAILKL